MSNSNFHSSMEPATDEELAEMDSIMNPEAATPNTVAVADEDGTNERKVLAKGPTLSELKAQAEADEAAAKAAPAPQPPQLRNSQPVPNPADLAMQAAAGEEPGNPILTIGDFSYPCRSKAPGSITAKISSFTAQFAQVAQGGAVGANGMIDRSKISADDIIKLSMAPTELFEVAMALVLEDHRDDLASRWAGEWVHPATGETTLLPDEDIIEAGDILPALMDLLPRYTAASSPKA